MKRAALLITFALIWLVTSTITFAQQKARTDSNSPKPKETCPFSIIGMWKPEVATETDPFLLNFSREGWVTLFTPSEGVSPDEFETVDAVKYRFDSGSPKRLEFTVRRGNDFFPPGTTSFLIVEYDDESFTTKDPASDLRRKWNRVQTHRYFLTLAGRRPDTEQPGSAFVMWTKLDGRKTDREVLGAFPAKDEAGKRVPTFGIVATEISGDFESESRKDSEPMLRIELGEAEYERVHKVFDTWQKRVEKHKLPFEDPYQNVMELFKNATESINTCRKENRLRALEHPVMEELTSKNSPPQRSVEYIRALRKQNNEMHVSDSAFPFSWRPMLPGN